MKTLLKLALVSLLTLGASADTWKNGIHYDQYGRPYPGQYNQNVYDQNGHYINQRNQNYQNGYYYNNGNNGYNQGYRNANNTNNQRKRSVINTVLNQFLPR